MIDSILTRRGDATDNRLTCIVVPLGQEEKEQLVTGGLRHGKRTHVSVCVCVAECGNLFITFIITPHTAFIDLLVRIVYASFIWLVFGFSAHLLIVLLYVCSSLSLSLSLSWPHHIQYAAKTYTLFSHFIVEMRRQCRWQSQLHTVHVAGGGGAITQIKDTLRGRQRNAQTDERQQLD